MPATAKTSPQDRAWVDSLLASAQCRNFYGQLIIFVENGEIKRVENRQSLKPPRPRRGGT